MHTLLDYCLIVAFNTSDKQVIERLIFKFFNCSNILYIGSVNF